MALQVLQKKAQPPKLLVRARGDAMVPNYEKHAQGVKAFVGRVFDRELRELADDPSKSEGGWRPTEDAVEVPATLEYVKAIVEGDLWAADEKTTQHEHVRGYAAHHLVNQGGKVVFDPDFGGEVQEVKDYLEARAKKKRAIEDAKTMEVANAKLAQDAADAAAVKKKGLPTEEKPKDDKPAGDKELKQPMSLAPKGPAPVTPPAAEGKG